MALSQGSVIIVSYLREFVLKLFVSIAPIKNDFKEIRMIPRLGQNFIFLFSFFFCKGLECTRTLFLYSILSLLRENKKWIF
ncbi:unnamed protein product [Meloidogyne enterolobii]|uniref:Uncharacterized protein n=1 Tax=Meloidogyne enterolobii TaxID=390850 RepID=A0ACB0YH30_MELEN